MKSVFKIRIFIALTIIAMSLLAYEGAYYFTVKFYADDEPYWKNKEEVITNSNPIKEDVIETKNSPLFLLLEKGGYVVIEFFQGGELYDITNIHMDELPTEIQDKLQDGIPIKNFEELYDFLENYSS